MQPIQNQLAKLLLLTAAFFCFNALLAHGPADLSKKGSLVYIDGKNVLEDATVRIRMEKPFSLEAYDLQPGSTITFSAKKHYKEFKVNDLGFISQLIFIPKKAKKLKCTVTYVTKSGMEREVDFIVTPI